MHHRSFRLIVLPAILLAAAAVLLWPESAAARGGAAAPAPAVRLDPTKGPLYFDQAVNWVNDGKPGIHNLRDFYADLADVKFNVEGNHHEGYMRLWLLSPDKYRVELRPSRPMQRLTTKVLNKDKMWIIHPQGAVDRMHGSPGGAAAIKQLTEDRKRLLDLAQFLTLKGLKGPNVKFVNEGPTRGGAGPFAGDWLRVRRKIPNGADVVFYLAYSTSADGRTRVARNPGIVVVVGDPKLKEPTEFYVLTNWKRGPQFRYPGKIEAFSRMTQRDKPTRFLLAFPNDIRINTGLDKNLFNDPAAKTTPRRSSAPTK